MSNVDHKLCWLTGFKLYVRTSSGVNSMLRKVAGAAASNPQVEIRQDGEQFYIKTSTSVRTTEINFHIGEEFNEETVDGRKCKVEFQLKKKKKNFKAL